MNNSTVLRFCMIMVIALAGTVQAKDVSAQSVNLSDQMELSRELIKSKIEALSVSPDLKERLQRAVRISPRIVGGDPVFINDHPWQVALVRGVVDGQRFQFCGGSLIAPQWVLTAAHCVRSHIVGEDPSKVDIVAGTAFYPAGGERLSVKRIIVHPNYSGGDFDFALLELTENSSLGRPVPYATSTWQLRPGNLTTVSGWGATQEGGRGSEDLLAASVPLQPSSTCNAPESYNGRVTENEVCAGERAGGLDSCQGDSGGPLTEKNPAGDLLVGVVSWGDGCARALRYGVYARVASVAKWISSQVDD